MHFGSARCRDELRAGWRVATSSEIGSPGVDHPHRAQSRLAFPLHREEVHAFLVGPGARTSPEVLTPKGVTGVAHRDRRLDPCVDRRLSGSPARACCTVSMNSNRCCSYLGCVMVEACNDALRWRHGPRTRAPRLNTCRKLDHGNLCDSSRPITVREYMPWIVARRAPAMKAYAITGSLRIPWQRSRFCWI